MIERIGAPPSVVAADSRPAGAGAAVDGFAKALESALQRLDATQREAETAAIQFATGVTDDLAAVILAGERARLALQLATAVRNRVLEAYQEIMRLPL